MSVTIGSHTPVGLLLPSYRTRRRSRNIVTPSATGASVGVTLRPASLRTGRLEALFDSLTDAQALEADLAAGTVVALADSDHPGIDMDFVLADGGELDVQMQPNTVRWLVICDFQEVE